VGCQKPLCAGLWRSTSLLDLRACFAGCDTGQSVVGAQLRGLVPEMREVLGGWGEGSRLQKQQGPRLWMSVLGLSPGEESYLGCF
jgi:hypothetical protein